MTRHSLKSIVLLGLLLVPACAAFKDAMTAHSDVVARAGSQDLTVNRLAGLLANSEAPLRPDVARTIAQIWVNYQLLGLAGAEGDSLATTEAADQGMWSAIAQLRTRKFYEIVSKDWVTTDPSSYEQLYNDGELLAAAHILLAKQPTGLVPTANDSVRRDAERLRATVTSANFARLARERSADPGSRERGGDYGVFPRGQMVPEFDAGVLSVAPGQISQVIETQYGFHIIRRSTWDEIKEQFAQAYEGVALARAESVFFDGVERAANVQVRSSAPKLVKAIAEDVDAYRDDRSVVATARSGNLTAGRLAHWIGAFPAQAQMRGQVLSAPDSVIPLFVKNIMRSELLLRMADSAGIQLDSAELAEVRTAFTAGVARTAAMLNLAPHQLADAGADRSARAAVAAARVDEYLGKLLRNEGEYIEVPEQLALVLRSKYESRVVSAGLDRALVRATEMRATADSLAAAGAPPSAVPVPGQPR
ncbi:MAG: peptidylprolyl isomerase [Gemmatimonadaceae bacterium]